VGDSRDTLVYFFVQFALDFEVRRMPVSVLFQYFIVFLDLLLSDECYLFQPLMLFVDPFVDCVPSFDQPAPGSSDATNSSVIQFQFVEDAFVHFRVVDSTRLVDAARVMDSAGVVLAIALFLEALFLGHTLGTQIFFEVGQISKLERLVIGLGKLIREILKIMRNLNRLKEMRLRLFYDLFECVATLDLVNDNLLRKKLGSADSFFGTHSEH